MESKIKRVQAHTKGTHWVLGLKSVEDFGPNFKGTVSQGREEHKISFLFVQPVTLACSLS
jgi:hypothetical protein